ncbi:MAG TPA: LacI family DNA-binding transcriptional regulator [Fervidobacterium sp.]|nr:LacI family DNA-binding transcriptional regulator [Fervidobacterium sp.]HPT54243.1 LacI family DNA-binding transcriptional regulator [Fervidobacterium sp.]HPZ17543.1 LacI family DNA-binding transcriptional regulator [Fervidobacterium sp.]HQE49338.1 LacI family DNA-binding transcriptional regulator [Fervidobacterium sp.]HUM42372.1 LacI family DNA-binding transcriptional regulator [Fervidobacterium sp.]
MTKRRFVTIKDIAQQSGLSVITVSRALSGTGYVRKETREKILRIAEELGYTKDSAASSLRTKKTKILGVVVVDNSNPFYAEVVKGIEIEARKNGYSIILVNTDRNYENEVNAINMLLQRRVDGLIITAVQKRTDDIAELVKKHIPNVIMGSKLKGIKTNYIYTDDEDGGYKAAKHLIELGKKNILLFNGMKYKYAARMREKGVKKAVARTNGDVSLHIYRTIEGFENAYQSFKSAFSNLSNQGIAIDAIICYNDIYAYAVIKHLNELGINIPNEIAVVGFDDLPFSSILNPPLTTVSVDKTRLGIEAFKALIKNIEDNTLADIVLPVELVRRKTT